MEHLTCEEMSRIYGKLGLFKTTSAVHTLVVQGKLSTEHKTQDDRRYSIYNFRINALSCIEHLNSIGYDDAIIKRFLN